MAAIELAWALSARRATKRAGAARAVLYSSTTAALLWVRPGAIRFDAPAAGNRPGRHGLWQRPLEARRLAQSPLLLPWSEGALLEAPAAAREAAVAEGETVAGGETAAPRALVVPVAIDRPAAPPSAAARRDIAAITYAANPSKKGLGRVLSAWRARRAQPSAP